jgi:hypothetical protein
MGEKEPPDAGGSGKRLIRGELRLEH